MKVPALTAAVVLSAATSVAGQPLVATTKPPFQVAASYGYSQIYHGGEWIRVDVVVRSERPGTLRLHEAFSLLTPDGERIDLPSQREYRTGIVEIKAMQARAANMQVSPWLAIPGSCIGQVSVPDAVLGGGDTGCRYRRLWGNGGIDWTATIGPRHHSVGAALYFHSPDGWPAGKYWLEVDGPGDLAARLPVRLH